MVLMSNGYLENGQFSVYYRYGHKYKHEQVFKNAQLELDTSKKDTSELLVSMQLHTTVTTIPDYNEEIIYEDEQRFPLTGNTEFIIYDNEEENDKPISLTWVNTELNETYEFTCDINTSLSDVNGFTRFVYQQLGIGDECQEPLIITNQFLYGSKHLLRKSNRPIGFIQPFKFTFPKGTKNETKPSNHLVSIQADFYIFIPNKDQYVFQESLVNVDLVSFQPLDHWLSIQGDNIPIFSQPIEPRINVNFNKEEKTMVWNYFENDRCYSLLLKVTDFEDWRELIVNFGQCIYESYSQIPFYKSCKGDQDYVINAIENNSQIAFEEQTNENNDIEDETDSVDSSQEEDEETYIQSDEDKEKEAEFIDGNATNEILTMSYKDHSAYILRGNKLGIYHSSSSNNISGRTSLYFSSSTSFDEAISARQAMLYRDESSYLVLKQDNRVAHYDLEHGKIVDEWGIDDENDALVSLAPGSKYAQITNESTLIGITSNAVFRIDPRSPEKVVQQQCKRYKIKAGFTSLTTSDVGHVIVGNHRGDIRLFDQLGQMGKTTLPPLGRSVQSLDVSADGRYVLATCQHYLMLYDVIHKDYDNQQQRHVLGYEKMFDMDDKPVPNILKIRPEQIMLMDEGPISFTKATFGTNQYNNRNIITSTGPYVFEWDMIDIAKGEPYPCRMQKFDDYVVTVTYDDEDIVVVLPNKVVTSRQKYFKKASTQSLFQLKARKKVTRTS
ncbi:VID27 cytoplasmic protein-domain-containing protein [Circinella umbellata]|nr:VID27 cytoplasmic protein-domain-containing protein [Circinella umbellata]